MSLVRPPGEPSKRRRTADFEVGAHISYAATRDSVLEPDVQVIEKSPRRRLPRRALLLIEVTSSSMYRDRDIKAPI